MADRKKYGWTVKGIIGMIFTPIGLLFLVLGITFWHFKVGNNAEDQIVFLIAFGGVGAIFFLLGLASMRQYHFWIISSKREPWFG